VFSVKPTDALAHVISKLAVVRMHRVFVADPKTGLRPTAVISISDLLKHIFGMEPSQATRSAPSMRVDGSPSLKPRKEKSAVKPMKPLV